MSKINYFYIAANPKRQCCESAALNMPANWGKWPQIGNGQFSFQTQRKAVPKNVQTTAQLHSSHMLAK